MSSISHKPAGQLCFASILSFPL